MGYWSTLYLIDVKIKAESLATVKRALKNVGGRKLAAISDFLSCVVLDRDSFLVFKVSEDVESPYVPTEEGTVPASYGKWYEEKQIASWLRLHSEKGGQMVLHSNEGDGEASGWEFDGRGRMRALQLRPVGKWE